MKIDSGVALVTGGNRGIGEAFVHELLAQGAGKVYVGTRNARGADFLAEQYPGRAVPVTLDVTDPDQVAAAATACADVNILINNAGYFHNSLLLSAPDMDAARMEMEVNYFGVLSMCRHFIPVLRRQGGGSITNVLSAGAIVAAPFMGGYSPSKFAARALTTNLRAELSDEDIHVGCLIVGSVDTRMAAHVEGQKESPAAIAREGIRAIRKNLREHDTDAFAVATRAGLQRDPVQQEKQLAALLKRSVLSTGV